MLRNWSEFLIENAKYLIGLIFIFLFLMFMKDPFFGDGISTVSRASFNILESGFSDFTYPDGQDPGHPTLFPVIYALIWTIFGKSLWISHTFNILFGFGTALLMYKWCEKEFDKSTAIVAVLFLCITPLFLAQVAMLNTHLPLLFFTIWFAYSLFYHKKYQAVIAANFLLLCHLQGLFYLGGIMLWWFFVYLKNRDIKFRIEKSFKLLILPFLLLGLWFLYHYQMKGWVMSTPSSDFYGRGYGGLKISIINWIVSFWRIIDYGQLGYFVPIVLLFFRKQLFKEKNHFLLLFLILFGLNSILLSFSTSLRTAHRYFLPSLPFLIIASVGFIHIHKKRLWLIATLLIVLSGHLWNYPGRTVGDATLSYRNVFPLLEEIASDYPTDSFYTYSPLSDANEFAYLSNSPIRLKSLYDEDYLKQKIVVRGNVSGDFSDELIGSLEKTWYSTSYQKGPIYFDLYFNPKLVQKPDNLNKRKISSFEQWFYKMKKRLRGE